MFLLVPAHSGSPGQRAVKWLLLLLLLLWLTSPLLTTVSKLSVYYYYYKCKDYSDMVTKKMLQEHRAR